MVKNAARLKYSNMSVRLQLNIRKDRTRVDLISRINEDVEAGVYSWKLLIVVTLMRPERSIIAEVPCQPRCSSAVKKQGVRNLPD